MKYRLGHAIIEWKDGGYSEAVFFQDREGYNTLYVLTGSQVLVQ